MQYLLADPARNEEMILAATGLVQAAVALKKEPLNPRLKDAAIDKVSRFVRLLVSLK